MNKQGPGKIDWTDWSWNPIRGKCFHNCEYCYMHGIWNRFIDHATHKLVGSELCEPPIKKNPLKIFAGSSTDMFGEWVNREWIQMALAVVRDCPWHTFQFLTKNPLRYSEFSLPKNGWYGTTVDGSAKTIGNLDDLRIATLKNPYLTTFISFEPLLRPIIPDLEFVDWVIIGADSREGAVKPQKEWADTIINTARNLNIPVWVKDNYGYPDRIKEFPK